MKHIKLFENFEDGWNEDKGNLGKLLKFLSEKDFDLYDGEEDLEEKFIEVESDGSLSANEKADIIANYLDEKWGLYDGVSEVEAFLKDLFDDGKPEVPNWSDDKVKRLTNTADDAEKFLKHIQSGKKPSDYK